MADRIEELEALVERLMLKIAGLEEIIVAAIEHDIEEYEDHDGYKTWRIYDPRARPE